MFLPLSLIIVFINLANAASFYIEEHLNVPGHKEFYIRNHFPFKGKGPLDFTAEMEEDPEENDSKFRTIRYPLGKNSEGKMEYKIMKLQRNVSVRNDDPHVLRNIRVEEIDVKTSFFINVHCLKEAEDPYKGFELDSSLGMEKKPPRTAPTKKSIPIPTPAPAKSIPSDVGLFASLFVTFIEAPIKSLFGISPCSPEELVMNVS